MANAHTHTRPRHRLRQRPTSQSRVLSPALPMGTRTKSVRWDAVSDIPVWAASRGRSYSNCHTQSWSPGHGPQGMRALWQYVYRAAAVSGRWPQQLRLSHQSVLFPSCPPNPPAQKALGRPCEAGAGTLEGEPQPHVTNDRAKISLQVTSQTSRAGGGRGAPQGFLLP